uniref:Nudix hydrolase domain-containing protein n=1 Tax=Populus trichocarpa TaxID=3694 RepID=A0A3N7HLK7_POPTR
MLSVSYNSKSFSNFSKTLSREVKIPIFSFRKKKEERTKFGVYNLRELQTEQTLARILVLNLLCKRNMRNLSFYLTNLTNFLNFLFPFLIKIPSKSLPVQIETMVSLVSRTGRNLQRYEKGCRLVVGCIPYRYKKSQEPTSVEELEVLVISAQNGQGMLFPKGGWENDESMEEAAMRETEEEAGVIGVVGGKLGPWQYKSKRSSIMHESYMFPLLVQEELDSWPESKIRKRRWVCVTFIP